MYVNTDIMWPTTKLQVTTFLSINEGNDTLLGNSKK